MCTSKYQNRSLCIKLWFIPSVSTSNFSVFYIVYSIYSQEPRNFSDKGRFLLNQNSIMCKFYAVWCRPTYCSINNVNAHRIKEIFLWFSELLLRFRIWWMVINISVEHNPTSTLKMDAKYYSETLVPTYYTRCCYCIEAQGMNLVKDQGTSSRICFFALTSLCSTSDTDESRLLLFLLISVQTRITPDKIKFKRRTPKYTCVDHKRN